MSKNIHVVVIILFAKVFKMWANIIDIYIIKCYNSLTHRVNCKDTRCECLGTPKENDMSVDSSVFLPIVFLVIAGVAIWYIPVPAKLFGRSVWLTIAMVFVVVTIGLLPSDTGPLQYIAFFEVIIAIGVWTWKRSSGMPDSNPRWRWCRALYDSWRSRIASAILIGDTLFDTCAAVEDVLIVGDDCVTVPYIHFSVFLHDCFIGGR